MRTIKLVFSALLAASVPLLPATALGQATTVGKIVNLRTGLGSDAFAIVTDKPILNPFGCIAPDGYISDSTMPGYETCYAAALLAFEAGLQVEVVFDNAKCLAGRPVIIGINVRRQEFTCGSGVGAFPCFPLGLFGPTGTAK